MSFPKEVVENALVASGRCCCICHKFCGVRIETHHIKPKEKDGEDSFENCIPLCFDCHAEVQHYNNDHPKGRKFSENELRKHRDSWFNAVKEMNTPISQPANSSSIHLVVTGKGNIVAGRDIKVHTDKIVKKTIVQTDPGGQHISNSIARKIQGLVKDYIDLNIAAGKPGDGAARRIWGKLKKEFNVTSYKEIANNDSEEAINWLHKQLAMARSAIRRKAPDEWKQSLFKPIYARMNSLGMSKAELYELALNRIPLKKPIKSLKNLTQRDLLKLHHIMIYEMQKSNIID